MKKVLLTISSTLVLSASMSAIAQSDQGLVYHIVNQNAQAIYQGLTSATQESALGNTFREGKSVLCWHIDKDVKDDKGAVIPSQDPRRYACSINFDSSGMATPGQQF